MTPRRTPVRRYQQEQHRDTDQATVVRQRRQQVRYTSLCGYYICYSIFVAVVGLTLLAVLLTVHLIRCVLPGAETEMSVYDCFVDLRLGPTQRRRPSTRRVTS